MAVFRAFRRMLCAALFALVLPFGIGSAFACQSNEFDVSGNCIENKFSITTTNLSASTVFKFQMTAKGVFYVDWGDGNTQTIDRTNNTTEQQYTHTYSAAGTYTIKFGGLATGYNSSKQVAAIAFGGSNTPTIIASVSGSLGAIFPTLNDGSNNLEYQPQFFVTFQNCTGLTSLPSGLFNGVSGAANYMFSNTFQWCSNLTSIPSDLFDGISGAADWMFHFTFGGTPLTSIPSGLFNGISGAADNMFYNTFYSCTRLTSIPSTLFNGISGAAGGMFYGTFSGCTRLTSIPSGLFNGISGAAQGMFGNTFSNCSGLTSVPSGLFNGISGTADSTFNRTFSGCTNLTTVPYNLFAGLSGTPLNYAFSQTFYNDSKLNTFVLADGTSTVNYIPREFFGTISGGTPSSVMGNIFYNNTKIASSCPAGTIQNITGYESEWNNRVSCIPTESLPLYRNYDSNDDTVIATVGVLDNYDMSSKDYYNNTTLTVPTRTDYVFNGFYNARTGGTQFYTASMSSARKWNSSSNALYAQWTACPACAATNASCSLAGVVNNACSYTTSCNSGYGNIQNNGNYNASCGPAYTVTYACGTGASGTAPSSVTTYSGASFSPSGQGGCAKSGSVFSGWLISGTETVVKNTFTWNYSTDKTLTAQWFDPEFTITTTRMSDCFGFDLSAEIDLTVDWGDGTVETIEHDSTDTDYYEHCYDNEVVHTIGFAGTATAYNSESGDSTDYSAIRFSNNNYYIASMSGSLGALFPTLNNGANNLAYQPRFIETFYDADTLTSVPSGLFDGITGGADYMFYRTFADCEHLSLLPYDLFADLSGVPAESMFGETFYNDYNLGAFIYGDGTSVPYIPDEFFGNISATNYSSGPMENMFYETRIVTSCPSGTTQNVTGFESDWNNRKSCVAGNSDSTFTITTTALSANSAFKLQISAAGRFSIDWGDENVSAVNRTGNTSLTTYSHTYTTAGTYQIKITGTTTGYSVATNTPAISFGCSECTPAKVAGVSGSLGTVFPTMNNGSDNMSYQPRFYRTFANCTNLTSVPASLFEGISGVCGGMFANTFANTRLTNVPSDLFARVMGHADNLFAGTFSGVTTLTTVPYNLFGRASGAASYMFYRTFEGAGLTTIPFGLFSGISGNAPHMFASVFSNCANLTSVPDNLFAGLSGTPSANLLYRAFYNDSNFNTFVYTDNSTTTYIPTTFFSNLDSTDYTRDSAMYQMFYNTGIVTKCPNGATQHITGFEIDLSNRKSCESGANYFAVTTTQMTADSKFTFYMSAAGEFSVDWGDGTISEIDRTGNTTSASYSHTYTTAGTYTITFTGAATEYTTNSSNYDKASAAISFKDNKFVATMSGSLGALFPTIGNGGTFSNQPRFIEFCELCSNLTTISSDLFDGIGGKGVRYQFYETFYESGLTTVPSNLFNFDSGASYMFSCVFQSNQSLISVASNVFNINGDAGEYMFESAFNDCQSLITLSPNIFNVTGKSAEYMFSDSFSNCDALETVPSNMFNFTDGAYYMFNYTFIDCENLTTIESNVFNISGITESDEYMFYETFCYTGVRTIKPNVFNLSGKMAPYMFSETFYDNDKLTVVPSNVFNLTDAAPYMFSHTFADSDSISRIEPNVFNISGITADDEYLFDETFTYSYILSEISPNIFNVSGKMPQYMFYETFYDCDYLTTVPANAFTLTDAAPYMFQETFDDCERLATIESNAFNISGITSDDEYMFDHVFAYNQGLTNIGDNAFNLRGTMPYSAFYEAFYDCDGLTYVGKPFNFTGGAENMFDETFQDSNNLTTVSADIFNGASGNINNYSNMFEDCFSDTPLEYFEYDDGTRVSYIPPTFFGNLNTGGDSYDENCAFCSMFNSTNVLEECPSGTSQYITGFEDEFDGRVSCISEEENALINPYWPFSITTTELDSGDEFKFYMSAAGTFYVDWGDESGVETINRTNNTSQTMYSHEYEDSGIYTIRFGGRATGYSDDISNSDGGGAIAFGVGSEYGDNMATPEYIASISGSLGAIFPTLNDGSDDWAYQPRFCGTFGYIENLQTIPAQLFNGVFGATGGMFFDTFMHSGLTSIPTNLFSGISAAADYMFEETFSGTSITSIPATLFRGVSGAAEFMFYFTFSGCTGLTSIPTNLFSGISGAARGMFYYTFSGCTGLTSIPATLFSGVSGAAYAMFLGVFSGCTGLTSIPSGLFSGVSGAEGHMFSNTFDGCSGLTTVPYNLFAGVSGIGQSYMFSSTFSNDSSLQYFAYPDETTVNYIPPEFFGTVSGGSNVMPNIFNGNTAIAGSCPTGTTQNVTGYESQWNGRKSCKPDYPFSITTTDLSANTTFKFKMSAAGTFRVDWGDGSAVQTIDRTGNTTETQYTHTYTNAGSYTIKFAGLATGYNDASHPVAAIRFGNSGTYGGVNFVDNTNTPTLIASMSGSLGAIFPTLGSGDANTPSMISVFYGATNLTNISPTLFSGITTPGGYMFAGAFYNCTSLTSIPEDLFAGITTGRNYLFENTFHNCSGLTSIPAGLFRTFSNLYNEQFYDTFRNCTGLTEIPSGLFKNIRETGGVWTFGSTFYGCSNLTTVPYDLFSGLSGDSQSHTFLSAFSGDTALANFKLADGSIVHYIPREFFGNLNGTGYVAGSDAAMYNVFNGTAIATSCPSGTVQNITGFEDDWSSKVSCKPEGSDEPVVDSQYPFSLTTTNLSANTTFKFKMSAAGTFRVDWGDGSAVQTINRTNNTTETQYTHTYTTSGVKTIRIGGKATGYSTYNNAAIRFGGNDTTVTPQYIASISGSIGAIFPTLNDGSDDWSRQPIFSNTFTAAGVLTSLPATLFDGVFGRTVNMFQNTFEGCRGLTSIPETLFSGISGIEDSLFAYTFKNCTGLTSIPATLFSGISGAYCCAFKGTFKGCTGLTSIPATLFSGVSGAEDEMFYETFSDCTGLTSLPETLFSGVDGAAAYMFRETFQGCTGLGSIPENLFVGVSGAADSMFDSTFQGCTGLTTIPSGLFDSISDTSAYMFDSTFQYCSHLTSIPSGLFKNITVTPESSTFDHTFANCAGLSFVPYDLFSGISGSASDISNLFMGTFEDSGLSKFKMADGSFVNFVPLEFFGDLSADDYTSGCSNNSAMCDIFNGTAIAETCPDGYMQYETGFEDDWDGKVSCVKSKFELTTIPMAANTTFSFGITAAGNFLVDWGDGTAQSINRVGNTDNTTYSHTYTTAGARTIKFSGRATRYLGDSDYAAIQFNGGGKISTMRGSLGAIFPTLNDGSPDRSYQPILSWSFENERNLTSIPSTLFDGIFGAGEYMFYSTFQGCTGLTAIPSGLFGNISGAADSMFTATFEGCTGLTSIPSDLFAGVSGAAEYLFAGTFAGCAGLTSIPSGLFAGVSGDASGGMFYRTFEGCTGLTEIPRGLFNTINSNIWWIFRDTFAGCTQLTTVPSDLFAGFTSKNAPANMMFENTFNGDTSLSKFRLSDGTTVNYVTPEFFGALSGTGYNAASNNAMDNVFNGTAIAETCPSGMTQNITGFEGDWSDKVSCTTFDGYKFTITTTNLSANSVFKFYMSARGIFWVDWGDGTVETINRAGTTSSTQYTHTYTTSGVKTIRFGGRATGYNTNNSAIRFGANYNASNVTPQYIASMSGSLGAIFPTLNDGADDRAYQPCFHQTFEYATNLTSLSDTLFDGVFGASYDMFSYTFYNCTGLTSLPDTLFSGISGAANSMFHYTFYNCTGLTSLPDTLFSGVSGAANSMFVCTFENCTGLTSLPDTLFSGISGAANQMFYRTFYNCTGLTSLPDTLFSGISGAANSMFSNTFSSCTGLTSIPSTLFSGVTGAASYMFQYTFYNCTRLTSIPSGLFGGISGDAVGMFHSTFYDCTNLTTVPYDLFAGVSGTPGWGMFYNAFNNDSKLQYFIYPDGHTVNYIPPEFFGSIRGGSDVMYDIFSGNTKIASSCPANTTQNITGYESQWNGRVSCTPSDNTIYPFGLTTTNLSAGTTFKFKMSAAGTFTVDWGDGSAPQTIDRTDNTTETQYTHTYASAGSYRIRIAGRATGYNTTASPTASVQFGADGNTPQYIASISGSLGAIFSTLNDGTADISKQPRFYRTFANCTNLTTLPETLFNGVFGASDDMFATTFLDCGLTSIPAGLFSGTSGSADYMFSTTFAQCASLTSVPETLFHGVSGASTGLFSSTFHSCTGLTTLPEKLFYGISGAAQEMFYGVCYGCTGLTSIPAGLFHGISGAAPYMFQSVFANCTSLESVPAGLFDGASGTATGMFGYAFYENNDLESVPYDLFSGASGTPASGAFQYVFYNASSLNKFVYDDGYTVNYIPPEFFGTISGGSGAMTNIFSGATSIATSCPVASTQNITGYESQWNSRVSCEPSYKFNLTTTQLSANTTFKFHMSAAGSFVVDWGDGTVETIDRTDNTTLTQYTHTYTTAGKYTIKFAGLATGYNSSDSTTTIQFGNTMGEGNTPQYIAAVSGSLGAIFPTLNNGASNADLPTFRGLFATAPNLTSIPADLFSGVSGSRKYMFTYSFSGTGLTAIPSDLFSGVTGAADWMFTGTFNGTKITSIPENLFDGINNTVGNWLFEVTFANCTRLTNIPAGLFKKVARANYRMFNETFRGCTSLTSVPSGLFSTISGSAADLYMQTFRGCTSLVSVPYDLFGESSGTPGTHMFSETFSGDTALNKFVYPNGTYVSYIPPEFFGNLDGTNYVAGNSETSAMYNVFNGTGIATSCPIGTTQNITGFEGDWSSKVSCTGVAFDPKFTITTTNLVADTIFRFTMSAAGKFYIDWGDGSALQTIDRTNNTETTQYTHTYTTSGVKTIRFDGRATGYVSMANTSAVRFGYYSSDSSSNTPGLIASVSGSLGAIFPTLNNDLANQPQFFYAFSGANQLTSVPATLFNGVTGAATTQFEGAFSASGLTTIPVDLFSGVSGSALWMFSNTFNGCTGLRTIPAGLFRGVTGAAEALFNGTFRNCTSLTSIPETLFAGVSGSAVSMFNYTFSSCTSLTSIPAGLFAGVTGGANGLFGHVFSSCYKITSIPSGLFAGITTPGQLMFNSAFDNCTSLTSIPADLFANLTGGASSMFIDTFRSCSSLLSVPDGLFRGITGNYSGLFRRTFKWCSNLKSVPADLFAGVSGVPGNSMFNETFYDDTSLNKFRLGDGTTVSYVPVGFFGNLDSTGYVAGDSENGKMYNVFYNSGVATACPAGTRQHITGFEADWSSKVSCIPAPFSLTTTNLSAGATFKFKMSAAGTFTVDWGDGTVQTIDRTNDTTEAQYTHTYESAGTYTISFSGRATAYTTEYWVSAIRFGNAQGYGSTQITDNTNTPNLIASMSGSIGAIFPTINGTNPWLGSLFKDATNLTNISPTLFNGISGQMENQALLYVFAGCRSLTSIPENLFRGMLASSGLFVGAFASCRGLTSIPEDLFVDITTPVPEMFHQTFLGCTSLTTIPGGLFRNLTGRPGSGMFATTFYGCSGLTSIPATLFSGITGGGDSAFYNCFAYCTGLTSVPSGLFAGISGNYRYMFQTTFYNCTSLTSVPYNLFAGVSGTPGNIMFKQTFDGDTALNRFVYPDGSYVSYIPEQFFGKLSSTGYVAGNANTSAMYDVFNNTGVATVCPAGTSQNITGFEDDWSSKVSCKPDYPFSVTTTNLTAGTVFRFKMSAAGVFTVDWGDGSAVETIDRTNDTTEAQYTHTYDTAGSYTIKFAGLATGYNTTRNTAAIRFGSRVDNNTPKLVASISGSLGAIFPTLNDGTHNYAYQPQFTSTFMGCSNLTSLPPTLFNGVFGVTDDMFSDTFSYCTGLTSLPGELFSGVSGAANRLFYDTFTGCTGLTTLPGTLFSGVSGSGATLFQWTFKSCTGLTSLPTGLFDGVHGNGYAMFFYTFQSCTNLKYVPYDLFRGMSGGINNWVFEGVFSDCTSLDTFVYPDGTSVNYITPEFFGKVHGGAVAAMSNSFNNNTAIASVCPEKTVQYVTGYEPYWNGRVSCIQAPMAITLDNNGATKGATPETAYLTYDTDWYADENGEQPLTKLTSLPTKSGKIFRGFYTNKDGTGTQVIDAAGTFVTTDSALRISYMPTTVYAYFASAVTCNTGWYLPAGRTVCEICPAGYFCPGGNFASDDNVDGGLNDCPAGFFCAGNGVVTPTACALGSISVANDDMCYACGVGTTTSATGQSTCSVACANAAVTETYATPAWASNNTVSNICVATVCAANAYPITDANSANGYNCAACSGFASGLYPHSAGNIAVTSLATDYNNDGRRACFLYRSEINGKYIAAAGDITATDCPAGTYTNYSSDAAELASQKVYFGETFTCSACAANTYSLGGATACIACLNNYQTYGENNSVASCKIMCPGGYYLQNANDTECSPVGAGHWSAGGLVSQGTAGSYNVCSTGLTNAGWGVGADEAGDCGRKLHVGDDNWLYLRSEQKTDHALKMQVDGVMLYGNMSPDNRKMSAGMTRSLKVNLDGTTYSVHDDTGETYE